MDGSTPTSSSKTTTGEKCDCPLQTHATCHVKKLKVTTIYKDRADFTGKSKEALKLAKPGDVEGAKIHTLEASLQNNRVARPIQDAAKKKAYQDQVTNGVNAAKQSVKDAGAQTSQAVKQTVQNRSVKGVQGPTGPTAEQKKQMGDGANAAVEIVHAKILNVWDRKIYERLQRYDVVIETLASFYGDTNASFAQGGPRAVNTVDIKLELDAEGDCPSQSHDFLTIKPLSYTGNQKVKTTPMPKGVSGDLFRVAEATWQKKTRKIVLEDVMSPTIVPDINTASNPLTGIIKLMRMGFEIIHPMELELRLQTCGKKDRTTVDPPDLTALLRVFRETSFAVGVKIPPFKKFERSSSKLKTETTTTSDWGLSKTKSTTFNHPRSKTPNDPGEKEKVEHFDFYIKINDVEVTLNDLRKFIGKELPETGKDVLGAVKSAAVGTKNAAVTAGSTAGNLALLAGSSAGSGSLLPLVLGLAVVGQRIERAWKAADFIAAIIGVMEKFPQCGFKITVEWSFLEGLFEASLATASGSQYHTKSAILEAANNRYVAIGWKGKIGVASTLLSGKIEASFGLLIDFSVVGRVEVRVAGQLNGLVEYKAEAEYVAGEGIKASAGPSGKICGRLFAVAALETCVYTWKKEIGIEAGLQLDTGIEWGQEGTKLKAKLKSLPVQWYFVSVNGRTAVEDAKLYVLYESKTLWNVDENVNEKKP